MRYKLIVLLLMLGVSTLLHAENMGQHLPMDCPGGKVGISCGGVEGGNDREQLARENLERKRAHQKNKKRYEEDVRRNRLIQEKAQRQRDAKAQQYQQELTNRRQKEEASAAKEVAKYQAGIRAEINRSNAVDVILYEQGSCPPSAVIINNTNLNLWVYIDFTITIDDEGSSGSFISGPVSSHGRQHFSIVTAPSCDSDKDWFIPDGVFVKWHEIGRDLTISASKTINGIRPARKAAVLTRRGEKAGSAMIQGAINQADQEERDRPAREARERAEIARAAEQKRIADEQAAANARAYEQQQAQKREEDSRDTAAALSTLLGTIATIEQGKADRARARQEEQQRQIRAQQEQQRRADENRKGMDNAQSTQGSVGYNACLKEGDIGCEAGRATANRNAEPVNNQRAYQALQERRAAEANQQIRQQEERYRLAQQQAEINAKRRAEENRYYAPLTCVKMSSMPYGNGTTPCVQNNCGRTIEVHGDGGMWSVGANNCFKWFKTVYAACEKNNGFDRSRNQCVR